MEATDDAAGTSSRMQATAQGPFDATTGVQPTCDASNRRKRWFVEGGVGVADTYEVCTKDAGNAYAWRSLLP
jgi:hypothetical protein